MKLDFQSAAEAIPELKTLNDKIEVVIIGYHHCPYSRKALAAKDKHPRWKQSGRVLFVGYDFGATGGFKSKTKYVGTFPIVYVRNPATHEFEHIGGGEDLEKYVDKVNSSGKLIL